MSSTGKKILVIDDDPKLSYVIQLNLAAAGHQVLLADDGPAGLALARSSEPDLVILDVMMPTMNGYDVCATLREEPGYPDCSILMLTALGEIADKGHGFEAGADDYLVKPFDPRELLWRVDALLRRVRRPHLSPQALTVGELELLPASLEVRTPERLVKLTRLEFQILFALAEVANQVVAPETLQTRVWGQATPDGVAAMRVHINRIRQRIEARPETPRYLRTVRGRGYMLAGTSQ
jgi:DNA-binding response OmpR family regulator